VASAYFLVVGPEGVQTAFNFSWGQGVFESVIEAASMNGWSDPAFSWSATMSAFVVVIWAFVGVETINYAGGEIKTPRTSMFRGFILGCLGVGVLYILVAYSVYYPYGEFIGAYDFLYDQHQDVLAAIMPTISPSIPFYAASLIGNPWVGILVTAAISLWFVNTMPSCFLANSRLAFALAMDRAWPDKLAHVNAKTGSPTYAIHLTGAVGLLGVFLMSQDVGVVLGMLNITMFFIMWGYGLSAMLLPYYRPDIYERSPIKWKVFGVPVIVLLGFVTFAEGWFFVFLSVMGFSKPVMLVLISTMVVGFVIYVWQQAQNKKRGIEVSKIYAELPPE
jgi:amino acid transporter